jgi:hypothetical protein
VAPNPSAQAFSTFPALLVHPKMVALFFRGIPVDMAYLWVHSLLACPILSRDFGVAYAIVPVPDCSGHS